MLRTMQALIQPKLVHRDLPLFAALLSDLFPGLEAPPPPADALRQAVEAELRASNLQVSLILAFPAQAVADDPCHSEHHVDKP